MDIKLDKETIYELIKTIAFFDNFTEVEKRKVSTLRSSVLRFERNEVVVREGDFVAYGSKFYEIVTLGEPREIFGQTEHKMEVVAKCIRAREGLFNAE